MCKNVGKNVLEIATISLNSLTAVFKVVAPNDPNLAKYEADAQTLLGQLATYKDGGPAADIVQIINIVTADVNLIPIPPEDQAVIAIALAGLESIISAIQLNANPSGVTAAAISGATPLPQSVGAAAAAPPPVTPSPVHVFESDPVYYGPFAAIRYTRDWNAQIGKRANLKDIKGTKISNRQMLKELLP